VLILGTKIKISENFLKYFSRFIKFISDFYFIMKKKKVNYKKGQSLIVSSKKQKKKRV